MHSQTEMEVERVCGLIIEQDRKKWKKKTEQIERNH